MSFTLLIGEGSAQALVCLCNAIAYEGSLNSWEEIKIDLRRRLGEPSNEYQVIQELTRTCRNRRENAEAQSKCTRELLDTSYMVGQYTDKTYYEKIPIEH